MLHEKIWLKKICKGFSRFKKNILINISCFKISENGTDLLPILTMADLLLKLVNRKKWSPIKLTVEVWHRHMFILHEFYQRTLFYVIINAFQRSSEFPRSISITIIKYIKHHWNEKGDTYFSLQILKCSNTKKHINVVSSIQAQWTAIIKPILKNIR